MQLTQIIVRPTHQARKGEHGTVLANVNIVLDDQLMIQGLRIIELRERRLVAMPDRELTLNCHACNYRISFSDRYCRSCGVRQEKIEQEGRRYADVAHPINQTFRDYLDQSILKEYDTKVT